MKSTKKHILTESILCAWAGLVWEGGNEGLVRRGRSRRSVDGPTTAGVPLAADVAHVRAALATWRWRHLSRGSGAMPRWRRRRWPSPVRLRRPSCRRRAGRRGRPTLPRRPGGTGAEASRPAFWSVWCCPGGQCLILILFLHLFRSEYMTCTTCMRNHLMCEAFLWEASLPEHISQ